MTSELNNIRTRINAALDIADTCDDQIRPHFEWVVRQMIIDLSPDKLTTSELAAMVAVLHVAHARFLIPPAGGRPTLRIIPTELESPQFSESVS